MNNTLSLYRYTTFCLPILSTEYLKKAFSSTFYYIYSYCLKEFGPCEPLQSIKCMWCNRELGLDGNTVMAKELRW